MLPCGTVKLTPRRMTCSSNANETRSNSTAGGASCSLALTRARSLPDHAPLDACVLEDREPAGAGGMPRRLGRRALHPDVYHAGVRHASEVVRDVQGTHPDPEARLSRRPEGRRHPVHQEQ